MSPPDAPKGSQKLYRSRADRKLAGVCGGIGEYFGIDPVLVRLLWIVFTLAGGGGVVAYLIAWLIVPEEPTAA
jgi:phage shock protein C